jgi:hypothetical protein
MSQVKDGFLDVTNAQQSQGKFQNPSQSQVPTFSFFLEFLSYPVPVISPDSFMVCGTCSSCQYKMEYVPFA